MPTTRLQRKRAEGAAVLRLLLTGYHHHLASDLSLDDNDFCGPSVVIRRYLSLAETCKEMRALVHSHALPALGERLEPLGSLRVIIADHELHPILRRLWRDPASCKRAELQLVAFRSELMTFGTKTAIVERLIEAMGLPGPRTVPPDLFTAVELEKELVCRLDSQMAALLRWRPFDPYLREYYSYRSGGSGARSVFSVRKLISQVYRVADAAGWQRLWGEYCAEQEAAGSAAEWEKRVHLLPEEDLECAEDEQRDFLMRVLRRKVRSEPPECCGHPGWSPLCDHRLCRPCCRYCFATAAKEGGVCGLDGCLYHRQLDCFPEKAVASCL